MPIKNLDTIEKEIYRLRLKAKNLEQKFDNQFENLHDNYSSLLLNTFLKRKKPREENAAENKSILSIEKLESAFTRIADHLIDKAADSIENVVDKMLKSKE